MISFGIGIYNPNKIYIYQLQTLIQSIYEKYESVEVEVIVYYKNMLSKDIELIKNKYNVWFKEFNIVVKNLAAYKTNFWYQLVKDCTCEYQVLLDCDMVLYKRIDDFFSDDFDVIYTYKTEEDENLNKILNTGTMLVKPSLKTINFFKWWNNETTRLLTNNNEYHGKWGAYDQHSLGELLTSDYSSVQHHKEIQLKGIPCKKLNETRCIIPTENTYIIHYKGRWRWVLPNGTWINSKKDKSKCNYLYNLWKQLYDRFNQQ